MRLVGLNTALKCGRLGNQGRTLSVIAQELRGYANQTVEDADALTAALQDIGVAAEGFERHQQDQGADRIAVMEREMATSLSAFQECGARLSQALAALAQEGGEVSRTLAETAGDITVHDDLDKALRTACDRLDSIVGTVVIENDNTEMVRERMRFFANGRYTMASERDIHAQFVPGRPAPATASALPPSPQPEASLDDILF
jgi:hypothetical protein